MSFSGHQNRERNGGKDTISGGLKQLEEIGDFRHSFSVKGVKTKTNVNL